MAEKATVRLVDASGVINPLTGGTGQSIDGRTVVAGDEILLVSPPNGTAYAGVWVAAAGAWTRRTDWDTVAEMQPGDWWYVRDGSVYQGTTFQFENTEQPATIDVTSLTIGKRTHRRPIEESGGIDISGTTPPLASLTTTGILAGTYSELTIGSDGRATAGTTAASTASEFAGFDTFIEGLQLVRVSTNALTAREGSAWIPGDGVVLDAPADIAKTGLTFSADTWYYIYFFDNAGTGDIERATVVPASPYRGEARVRSDNEAKRFIGSVRAGATSNTTRSFERYGNWVYWQEDTTTAPQRVLSAGTVGNTWTVVNCNAVVPPTARVALLYVRVPGGQAVDIGSNGTSSILNVGSLNQAAFPLVLNSSQQFYYKHPGGAPGTGTNIDVLGYYEPLA